MRFGQFIAFGHVELIQNAKFGESSSAENIPSDVRIDDAEQRQSGLVQLHEHSVVDLTQTQDLQSLNANFVIHFRIKRYPPPLLQIYASLLFHLLTHSHPFCSKRNENEMKFPPMFRNRSNFQNVHLARSGMELVDTTNTDDEGESGFTRHVDVSLLGSLSAQTQLVCLRRSVLLHVLLCSLEDSLSLLDQLLKTRKSRKIKLNFCQIQSHVFTTKNKSTELEK